MISIKAVVVLVLNDNFSGLKLINKFFFVILRHFVELYLNIDQKNEYKIKEIQKIVSLN